MRTGEYGQVRAQEDIYPASVIKIALMTETFRRFAECTLVPSERAVISAANMTETAEATPLVPGYAAQVDELVELMIARSDNIATNQLIDLLRRDKVTATMCALGLDDFVLGRKLSGAEPLIEDPEAVARNSMSPIAAAKLLHLIARDEVDGAHAQRELLERCTDRDKLVAGLRSGDRFMHKTGETSTVTHDAGILHTAEGREYVAVLYTTRAHADANMAQYMRHLRQHL